MKAALKLNQKKLVSMGYREPEFKVLPQGLEQVVASGNAELLLLSGYSGMGKSALVNGMHWSLVAFRAFTAEGYNG